MNTIHSRTITTDSVAMALNAKAPKTRGSVTGGHLRVMARTLRASLEYLGEMEMGRLLTLLYGVVCYSIFFASFLYAIGFVNNLIVPKSVSGGEAGPIGTAVVVNVLLLSVFAVQHTIMARPVFKAWFTKVIPAALERSTFVLASSLSLFLMYWQWRPMPEVIWQAPSEGIHNTLIGVSLAGFGIVLYGSFLINHFDLFGLRQVWLAFQGKEYTHVKFKVTALYRYVRNPLMLGFIIAFWATPLLTQAHLLFAAVTTGYIFFGVYIEERDIARHLGDEYSQYRARTNMIIPFLPRR